MKSRTYRNRILRFALFLLAFITPPLLNAMDPVLTLEDSFLQTSWRNQTVSLRVAGKGTPGAPVTVSAHLTEWPDAAEIARSFPGVEVLPDADGLWQVELSTPLEGLKTWSRQYPNLYTYTASATSGEDRVNTGARRVGLREIWIEDGSYILNGNPLVIVDDVWPRGLRGDHENVKRGMIQARKMGFSGTRLTNPMHIAVADEVGMPVITNVGSFVRLNIWNPASGLTRMDGDENRDQIRERIRNLREHPSIVSWSSAAPYSLATMHPEYTGQYFDTWNFFPLNRFFGPPKEGQLMFKELTQIVEALDGTRPVAGHNGPFSPVQIATLYLTDNLDLQEREEFYDVWFRSLPDDKKVIWISELGTPFAGHQFIRYIDHQMPQGGLWPKIHLENLARLIGEDAYTQEETANFPRWVRDNFYPSMKWDAVQEVTRINVRGIIRSYRTYGVNFSGHHIINENAFGPILSANSAPEVRKGLMFPDAEVDPVTPAARAYLDAATPVKGYIGGPDGFFANKDHLFFSGGEVRKAYILINDLDDTFVVDGTWELVGADGTAVLSGDLSGEVGAGRRALSEFPIEFDVPSVEVRTQYILRVNAEGHERAKLDDEFVITVFPEHSQPDVNFGGRIFKVNISDDLTHETPHFFHNRDNQELLTKAGVSFELVEGFYSFEWLGYSPAAAMALLNGKRERSDAGYPGPDDLLIIPREVLQSGLGEREMVLRALERMNLDQLVRDGLRVLVLEQNLTNILGVNTESTRPRRSFIAAPGHPVFAGLEDSDLSYWTGSSSLTPAITPLSPMDDRFPERVWNTSNTNAVATRPYIRPQTGAVRALAVSGFDLQESPLLEYAIGRGRIILCQYDVTTRYGIDPAATRLFDNIIAYLTTVDAPNPERGVVTVVAADDESVADTPSVYRAALPEGEIRWGITRGELFFRESLYVNNQVTRQLPEVTVPVFTGGDAEYPTVIRQNGDRLETTLSPEVFDTGWMKRKAAWIQAALKINQGGSDEVGPGISLHGRPLPLYPFEWVERFVHPYSSDIW